VSDGADLGPVYRLHRGDEKLAMPGAGEAVINDGLAAALHLSVGDSIILRNGDMEPLEVRIAGIFDNYVFNYCILDRRLPEQGAIMRRSNRRMSISPTARMGMPRRRPSWTARRWAACSVCFRFFFIFFFVLFFLFFLCFFGVFFFFIFFVFFFFFFVFLFFFFLFNGRSRGGSPVCSPASATQPPHCPLVRLAGTSSCSIT
jgi:hypothetical protein